MSKVVASKVSCYILCSNVLGVKKITLASIYDSVLGLANICCIENIALIAINDITTFTIGMN